MIATTASGRPDAAGPQPETAAIDEEHLGRMTLGDFQLEREVLQIFVRQSVIMLERIAGAACDRGSRCVSRHGPQRGEAPLKALLLLPGVA